MQARRSWYPRSCTVRTVRGNRSNTLLLFIAGVVQVGTAQPRAARERSLLTSSPLNTTVLSKYLTCSNKLKTKLLNMKIDIGYISCLFLCLTPEQKGKDLRKNPLRYFHSNIILSKREQSAVKFVKMPYKLKNLFYFSLQLSIYLVTVSYGQKHTSYALHGIVLKSHKYNKNSQ